MPRLRAACPSCHCLSISKRSRIGGYKCTSCKHEFEVPIYITPNDTAFDRKTYMRRYRSKHTEASKWWEAANRERRA